jgi:DNA-binding transcriptional ArsR family regulator
VRVGVIAEGPADFAVVRSVIKAALGLDAADVDSIRPDLQSDETSLHTPSARTFSNWEIVKQECVDGSSIKAYLASLVDEARLVVVHIDAAECHLPAVGVARPPRDAESYVADCRSAVANAVRGWTAGAFAEHIVEAIAVEETDAWLIPLYDAALVSKKRDSGTIGNPKEHLARVLEKTNRLTATERSRLKQQQALARYTQLSAPLRRLKELREVAKHNASLDLFVLALRAAAERLTPSAQVLPDGT